ARQITAEHGGTFPATLEELVKLPGIGPNTAGAIMAYAYEKPTVFLETNIRTVYIHHFFHDQTDVPDKAISELVAKTLEREHTREWYWALMDYGAHLKKSVGNLNRFSKSYNRQSTFEGSRRQIRGQVLRLLGERPQTLVALEKLIADSRLAAVIDDLTQEGLIRKQGRTYRL
ncbi:MAG TPA: A/G-specific adenine glycosylase, partial [Verrucomicrobiae bacterium]|nr:A/G-specific adenine glycosylase [Verrucomicrobiae bacterium]